jgi:hypothetical protein
MDWVGVGATTPVHRFLGPFLSLPQKTVLVERELDWSNSHIIPRLFVGAYVTDKAQVHEIRSQFS